MGLTLNALELLCNQAEENRIFSDEPFLILQVYKKFTNKQNKARIFPGVMGQILEWGRGTPDYPSVVEVKVKDVRKFLIKARTMGIEIPEV